MPEIIVFRDSVELFCDYLRGQLPDNGWDVPVVTRVPADRPADFVQVSRTGGTRRNLVVDDSQLSFECWGASEQRGQDLAQLVRALIIAARGQVLDGAQVYAVGDVAGPGQLPAGPVLRPDPLSNQPRFSFTMLVSVRGAAI